MDTVYLTCSYIYLDMYLISPILYIFFNVLSRMDRISYYFSMIPIGSNACVFMHMPL